VIECFAAGFGGFNCNGEVFLDFALADELLQPPRTQLQFE